MERTWTQGAFWSTAAQLIPVLGLALVLEARALAKNWTLDRAIQRRVEAVVVFAIAISLSIAFSISISALASGEDRSFVLLAFATLAMQISFYFLAVNALAMVVSRGTMDIAVSIERIMPWSLTNRQRRRIIKSNLKIPAILAETEEIISKAQVLRQRAKATVGSKLLLSDEEVADINSLLSAPPPPPQAPFGEEIVGIPRIRIEFEGYQRRPSPALAAKVRGAGLDTTTRLFAIARLQRVELLCLKSTGEQMLKELSVRPYSELDREFLERSIKLAADVVAFPWYKIGP